MFCTSIGIAAMDKIKAADVSFLPWNRIFKKSSGCNISVDVNPAPQPASKCSIRSKLCAGWINRAGEGVFTERNSIFEP